MNNQTDSRLFNKKTFVSAATSALITAALTIAVCGARGETLVLGQPVYGTVSDSHTEISGTLLEAP